MKISIIWKAKYCFSKQNNKISSKTKKKKDKNYKKILNAYKPLTIKLKITPRFFSSKMFNSGKIIFECMSNSMLSKMSLWPRLKSLRLRSMLIKDSLKLKKSKCISIAKQSKNMKEKLLKKLLKLQLICYKFEDLSKATKMKEIVGD